MDALLTWLMVAGIIVLFVVLPLLLLASLTIVLFEQWRDALIYLRSATMVGIASIYTIAYTLLVAYLFHGASFLLGGGL